jgi:hypothetical protein
MLTLKQKAHLRALIRAKQKAEDAILAYMVKVYQKSKVPK